MHRYAEANLSLLQWFLEVAGEAGEALVGASSLQKLSIPA